MADKYPEIFVLRHGQTKWNRDGRFQGSLNSPLTELGERHAATQGEILQALGHTALPVFSSPQGRTRQTADIVTGILGCAYKTDDRLVELRQGAWEGLFEHEIKSGWPDAYGLRDSGVAWYFANPSAESCEQLSARCESFLAALSAPCVIVTHGVTSHILRGLWLGLDFVGSAALTGGQGCVYHLRDGQQIKLDA